MIQSGQGLGLADKPGRKGGVSCQRLRQNLKRDDAIELRLTGFEDAAHAALADEF